MRNYLSFIVILFSIISIANAQNATTTSGGSASGVGGSCSYSIGQAVYTSQSGSTGSLNQGVQQAFDISVLTETEPNNSVIHNAEVYPNPTSEILKLSVSNFENANMQYELFDYSGKLIETHPITGNETIVPMSNLAQGTYLLVIKNNKLEAKTFKIIKN